jgi:hypothetical protein
MAGTVQNINSAIDIKSNLKKHGSIELDFKFLGKMMMMMMMMMINEGQFLELSFS